MQRVMIVGGPGSGKSTLARKLGGITSLPVFHMDKIHYESGWVERPSSEKSEMTRQVHRQDQWIFEGGHSKTYAERVARADTFIWLDFPLWIRMFRVLKRAIHYRGQARPDLPAGCPEQFNAQTLGFLGFVVRTRKSARLKLLRIFDNPPPHVESMRFTDSAAIKEYLNNLEVSKGVCSDAV